jgi:peptidoglycan/xylan/chitin deacetylase (PgdA/CDA1 family)
MRVPILCYHKIGDPADRSLNVKEEDFRRQVGFLSRRGYRFRRLDEWPRLTEGSAILTFDDVYATTAECLLRMPELTGTLFVVPSMVGGASAWDGDSARPLAHWGQVTALFDRGFEIGNHTYSHADLSKATNVEISREIEECEEALSSRFGGNPATLAYPYGRYDGRVMEALERKRYAAAVTTKSGIASIKGCPFELPRIKIGYSDGVAGLMYKLYIRPHLGSRSPIP